MRRETAYLEWHWNCPVCNAERCCRSTEVKDGREWEHKCSSCAETYIVVPNQKRMRFCSGCGVYYNPVLTSMCPVCHTPNWPRK